MPRNKKFSSLGNTVDPKKPYITKLRKVKNIIFHCSATPTGRNVTAKDIDAMHRMRWGANSGCGYHFIIRVDGVVEKGRWSDSNGSHAGPNKKIGRESSNPETIAVVYAGGVDKNLRTLKEGMNEAQKRTAAILLNALVKGYNLGYINILGHNELPKVNKGCPCTYMKQRREDARLVNN